MKNALAAINFVSGREGWNEMDAGLGEVSDDAMHRLSICYSLILTVA